MSKRPKQFLPPRSLGLVLLLALGIFLATALGARTADLDVVFALDTTGSMGGELREVQERVEQLAVSLGEAYAGSRIRFGIVAYRDRGDEYVTRISPLTEDVAASRSFLASLVAAGGGDGPESVVAALAAAIREMSWDFADTTERQVFLIGDAPPHLDYADEPTPEVLAEEAQRARIVVNAIGCRSLSPQGVDFFRSFAYATEGSYQHIGRVRSARAGALTEAMSRAMTSRHEGAEEDRVENPLTWMQHDADVDDSGILVRQGGPRGDEQDPGGVARPCSLEVLLPSGLGLEGEPRARLGTRGLEVELDVGTGEGGLEVFAMETCPPLTTPIHVVLGGH